MSNPARALQNTTGAAAVTWNHAEVTDLLVSTRGPAGQFLSRLVGPAIVAEAQRRAPISRDGTSKHEAGKLRSSIVRRVGVENDTLFVDIGARAFYALMVDKGTKSHEIKPRRKRGHYPLRDKQGHVFGRHVHHPGSRANHFLEESLVLLRY